MKVDKVINNNLVRSYDEKGREALIMGCGLGFKKKPGDEIDESLVEKVYISASHERSNKLAAILENIPYENVQVTNEIISYARQSLGKKLDDNIYITLTDHISYAVERAKQGILLKNALLWEIKRFYNHEYLIGKEAIVIIEKKLGIKLPEDEAGFIALHLVNAQMDRPDMGETTQMTKMIHQIINIVKYHFHMDLDEYSVHYERFITHLKFFAQRVFLGNELDDGEDGFLDTIREMYQNEYQCAGKVKDYVYKEFKKTLTEDEMIYLTIHMKRITTK